jgi:hypothetical protein
MQTIAVINHCNRLHSLQRDEANDKRRPERGLLFVAISLRVIHDFDFLTATFLQLFRQSAYRHE